MQNGKTIKIWKNVEFNVDIFMVNMDHITDVEEEFLLRNGERVPIRVRGRKDVLDAYNHYFRIKSSGNWKRAIASMVNKKRIS